MAEAPLLHAFYEHEGGLRAYMAARLRCSFTAQDLIQDLYLKVSIVEEGPPLANARAYLYRMAANLVTDHQRRVLRQDSLLIEAEELLAGDGGVSPEEQAMAREELQDLVDAVAAMPPVMRRVFKLNRFDGKTQREIAAQLGISQTAVEKHIRKALDRLAARRHGP